MRLFLLSTLLSTSLAAAAAPPGYHAPRRFLTAGNLPYHRLPLRLNAGVNLGYYNGDLTNRLRDNKFKVGLNVGLAKTLSPRLTFALDLSYLHLAAQDIYPQRGYAFTSNNVLLTTLLRFNLLADRSMLIGPKHKEMPVLPFLSAGVGAMLFDPSASQYGFPLAAEAKASYPGLAAVLPVGGGVTLRASQRLAFTAEALYYFASTDLLDDVKQRGNPNSTDDFGTLTLKVEYSLGKSKGKLLTHND
ncbi:MAG: hypothetical protein ACRYG7_36165 [Janthinobacterium lividum]